MRLSIDLDARNESYDGVVLDIRNNDGGFVNGYALDVFTRKNYMTMESRGFPRITGRAALGTTVSGTSYHSGYQIEKHYPMAKISPKVISPRNSAIRWASAPPAGSFSPAAVRFWMELSSASRRIQSLIPTASPWKCIHDR